ncbi:retrovirus-related pol polyprotein from transposon TNT 1-94 [Tanacetum coccineum]
MFTKVDESPSKTAPEITYDSEFECDVQEPMHPLPKLLGAEPIGTSADVITLADLTQNPTVSEEIKNIPNKRSAVKAPKKKAQTMSPSVPDPIPVKKADLSTEQLLLTLMEEVKGLKEQIKTPLDNSVSVSQTGSDTKGYGSVNCNGITFTRVAYVNGLKHNLISISQLCDANFKVLFTKTQGTIFNQNNEVITIENLNEVRVKELRSNNGTEFRNHKLEEFLAKSFSVFSIKKKEMEETYHVTFTEDDEAISKSSTEGDEINFNEKKSFLDDEFLIPRSKVTQSYGKDDYFPYVPAYDPLSTNSITIPDHVTPTSQNINSLDESPEFTIVDDHPIHNKPDDFESADNLKPAKVQDSIINEPIKKHIDLVNIISEPLPSVTTRSRMRDSKAASAHECLYVNFLSEIKPKKLIEALEEEGWIIAMQEELNQFKRNNVWTLLLSHMGFRQEEGINYNETFAPVARLKAIRIFLAYAAYMGFMLDKALYGLKQAPRAWYESLSKFLNQHKFIRVPWIKSQLADYDVLYDNVPIFCDNASAIAISNNPVLHSRTQHIDIRYHFIRDHILKGDIELHFVPTDMQLADIFIKPLAEPSFTRLVAELDMLNIEKEVPDKKKALSDPLT